MKFLVIMLSVLAAAAFAAAAVLFLRTNRTEKHGEENGGPQISREAPKQEIPPEQDLRRERERLVAQIHTAAAELARLEIVQGYKHVFCRFIPLYQLACGAAACSRIHPKLFAVLQLTCANISDTGVLTEDDFLPRYINSRAHADAGDVSTLRANLDWMQRKIRMYRSDLDYLKIIECTKQPMMRLVNGMENDSIREGDLLECARDLRMALERCGCRACCRDDFPEGSPRHRDFAAAPEGECACPGLYKTNADGTLVLLARGSFAIRKG